MRAQRNAAKLLARLGFDAPAQSDSFLAAAFSAAARMARIFEIRSPYAAGLLLCRRDRRSASYGRWQSDFPSADVSPGARYAAGVRLLRQ